MALRKSETMMMNNLSERATYWKLKEIETVKEFIQECCYLNVHAEVKTKELYDHYILFCENTVNPLCMVGKNKFSTMINTILNTNAQIVRSYRTNAHRGWHGIGINFGINRLNKPSASAAEQG